MVASGALTARTVVPVFSQFAKVRPMAPGISPHRQYETWTVDCGLRTADQV